MYSFRFIYLQKCPIPVGYSTKAFICILALQPAFLIRMRHFCSSILLDGVRNSKLKITTKIKHFLRTVGILRVYLDSGDDFQ